MKIFIDFDDVVFNTRKFKQDFREMFIANGVPGEIFDQFYVNPKDTRAIKTFDPWLQVEHISGAMETDKEKLNKLVQEFIEDISLYIFKDVADFANVAGSENTWVVSFGELEFQTKKIKNSNIRKYIPKIIITEKTKSEEIENIIKKENIKITESIFFLDDRIEQIQDVKNKFPEIITILVKRPEGRYQEMHKEKCCDFEIHNLKEAEKIIKKIA